MYISFAEQAPKTPDCPRRGFVYFREEEPSSNDWVERMWGIYTMEYYSALKKDQLLLFVTRWWMLGVLC